MNPEELAEWLAEVTDSRDTIRGWGAATGTHPQLEAVVEKLNHRVAFLQTAMEGALSE